MLYTIDYVFILYYITLLIYNQWFVYWSTISKLSVNFLTLKKGLPYNFSYLFFKFIYIHTVQIQGVPSRLHRAISLVIIEMIKFCFFLKDSRS